MIVNKVGFNDSLDQELFYVSVEEFDIFKTSDSELERILVEVVTTVTYHANPKPNLWDN